MKRGRRLKDKMLYRMQNIKAGLINNLGISLSVILSVIIGGIFSIGLTTVGFNIYESTENRGADYKDIYILKGDRSYQEFKEAADKFDEVEYISGDVSSKNVLVKDGEFAKIRIIKAQIEYEEFLNDFIESGRYFSEDDYNKNKKVCVIGKDFFHEGDLGKDVTIGGESYEIVGSIRIKEYSDLVFFPLTEEELRNTESGIIYQLKFKKGVDEDQKKKIAEEITGGVENGVLPAEEYFKKYSKNRMQLFWIIIVVAGIVFMYSMINICTMFINKFQNDKRSLGIKMALGAGKKDIRSEVFWQLNILMFTGLIISMGVLAAASIFIDNITFTVGSGIAVMIFGFLWNIFLTGIIMRKIINKTGLREVIEG